VSSSNEGQPGCLRVLGVDPAATGPTGYAVLEVVGCDCRVLQYGALKVPRKRQKASCGAVLHDVHELLCGLIRDYEPHVMAVESVFTALNMRTALRLAEVRGVVLLAAEQAGLTVRSYSPREIKACVTGYGHADKRQMQQMVRVQLGLKELPEPFDAADALAVALCHLQADRLEERFGVSNNQIAALARRRLENPSTRATPATGPRILRIQSDR
jgi:crossover junction endodeoxyribonuclease RuvC